MAFFDRIPRAALAKNYTPEGVFFVLKKGEAPKFPLGQNDSSVLAGLIKQGQTWSALEELWEEGLLEQLGENSWRVPYSVYEKFTVDEEPHLFNDLGLPIPGPLDIEAKSRSSVADQGFRIHVEAHHPEIGPLRDGDTRRCGPVFFLNESTIVPLTPDQRNLFDLSSGNETDWLSLEDRMHYLAQVKNAALTAGARIDQYLASEEYIFSDEALIDFHEDSPSQIRLQLKLKGADELGIQTDGDFPPDKIPAVVSRANERGGRKRLVVAKKLRENLAKLPLEGKVTGQDVPRLLTNPDQIIPEGFDLQLFSERVKGVKTRVYNSRPYLHVQRTTGGWFEGIPGIELENWSPGEAPSSSDIGNNLSRDTYRKLLQRARENNEEFIQHGDTWIRVDPEKGERFEKVLQGLPCSDTGNFRIPAGSILDIYDNVGLLEFVDPVSIIQEDSQLPDDLPDIVTPNFLSGELFPHQFTGYRWLNRIQKYNIGGLLADDMGLGKTIQIIAHMLKVKEDGANDGPNLIVVPKSLIENWMREIKNFSSNALSVFRYDGQNRYSSPDRFMGADVVITTYDTLRRDQAKLATVNWNLVACDEAQYVKNPTAIRTSAVKALKSRHRAALTGTPVENGLVEFWCIMDFVQPGLLGSWSDFRKNYEHPILEGAENEREKHIGNLLEKIRGHYLRRMKEEILKDLPLKNAVFIEVSLSDEQLNLYRSIAHRGKSGGKGAALGAIQQLLMLSAHPMAIQNYGLGVDDKNQGVTCPKLEETLDIIAEIRQKGEKVIIFTDYKKIQKVLQNAIRNRFGVWPDIINGEITGNRQIIIDIFSEKQGFNVLILGHQVGGVGLNITAANHVIHYTRPWNPAKENQATDRVHRIGQLKPVTVYYPIVMDARFMTVEEKLNTLIRSKGTLAKDVLRPSSEFLVRGEDLLDCLEMAAPH